MKHECVLLGASYCMSREPDDVPICRIKFRFEPNLALEKISTDGCVPDAMDVE